MKSRLCTGICFALMTGCLADVQNIYVSPQGNDEAKGTSKSPVATLEQACALARKASRKLSSRDSIVIKIQPGTYFLKHTLSFDETDKIPVTMEGHGSPKPVISGGMPITGWEKQPDGLWKTTILEVAEKDLYFEQLFVNGRRATRARTPNQGFFTLKSAVESDQHAKQDRYAGYARQKLEMNPEDMSTLKSVGAREQEDIVMTFFHKWDVTRKHPEFMNVEQGIAFTAGEGMKPWNPLSAGTRYYLENYREALDEPGEWFLSRKGELFYHPLPGEQMERAEVIAPMLKQLVTISGTDSQKAGRKTFRNLSFRHSADRIPRFGNAPMQAAAAIEAAIQLKFADKVEWIDCEVRQTGNYGFWFQRGTADCLVSHCFLHDLGAGGIKIGETAINEPARRITVDNNIIHSAGWVYPCAIGVVIFQGMDNRVTHNDIGDLRYSGISVGWMWGYNDAEETIVTQQEDAKGNITEHRERMKSPSVNNQILDNHIHHIGWGVLSDMGAVYTLGESPGTRIAGNVIHDVYSYDYGGWGLYNDEGSSHIVLENNLVYGCKSGGYHQHYGKENIIRNNIFAFGQYFQLQLSRAEPHQSFEFSRNIVLMDCGTLMSGAWNNAKLESDHNCFWDLREKAPDFAGAALDQWQARNRDTHSLVENPGFKAPEKFDFTFVNDSAIKKTGFIPFDYTKAGVYGSREWKDKARLPEERHREFVNIIKGREKEYSRIYTL